MGKFFKTAESIESFGDSPIEVKNDGILARILSRPTAWTGKLLFWDSEMNVFDFSSIDKGTIDAAKDLSKFSKSTKIFIGTSPVIEAMARSLRGEGVTFKPLLLRPLGVVVAGLGGIQGKLSGSDYYSPASDIVSIRSNVPAVAAHEIGHSVDYHNTKLPTLYNWATSGPGLNLIPEYHASRFAGDNLKDNRESLKSLTPGFGSYVGGAFGYPFIGAIVGHSLKDDMYFGKAKDKELNKRKNK